MKAFSLARVLPLLAAISPVLAAPLDFPSASFRVQIGTQDTKVSASAADRRLRRDLAGARQSTGASEGGPQVPQVPQVLREHGGASCWDRDEWDIAIADGTVYRLYVERDVGQWFLEGVVD